MSGEISFGGLVSGLDTNALVDKLVAIEKLPIQTYQKHQADDNAKLSVVGQLLSSVQVLAAAAQDLATTTKANPLTATSSDTSIVGVTASDTANSGSYSLTIDHLARAQVNSSTAFDNDVVPGDGSVSITVGAGHVHTVPYKAGDKLEDVAASINNLSLGVTASVLYDGSKYRLMITANQTGVANGMTLTDGGAGLGFSADGSEVVTPLDAQFTLNNVIITRASNHVTDALPGVTLDLRAPTPVNAPPTSIVVGLDQVALQKKVQTLVDGYNSVESILAGQLAYSGAKKGSDSLYGDSAVIQLQRTVQSTFTAPYGTSRWSGVQLGISLQKDGTMSFDASKFSATLSQNPTAAQDLFTGNGSPGLAQALSTALDTFTRPVDGLLIARQDALTRDARSYDAVIQRTTDAANALDARLRAQFSAMEQALSLMQSQSGLLNALGAGAYATTNSSASKSTR